MPGKSRSVLLMAALVVGAFALSALPARAQTFGLLEQAAAKAQVADTTDTTFLTAGMVAQAPPPGGRGPRAQGFGIGVKFGPLFTSYSAASCDGCFNTNTGWEGGLWFGGNRGGRVGVMGEILYAKKKASQAGLTGTTLQYLEIPILARINIGSRSRNGVSVYGLVGPVFDINLKAKQGNLDVKSNYESLDLGILGGVGIEITRFLLEARYNKGLRNVLKGGGANITDIKTKSFAVLFGLRFN
jgi:Outer membrane protein beta-barrel domain